MCSRRIGAEALREHMHRESTVVLAEIARCFPLDDNGSAQQNAPSDSAITAARSVGPGLGSVERPCAASSASSADLRPDRPRARRTCSAGSTRRSSRFPTSHWSRRPSSRSSRRLTRSPRGPRPDRAAGTGCSTERSDSTDSTPTRAEREAELDENAAGLDGERSSNRPTPNSSTLVGRAVGTAQRPLPHGSRSRSARRSSGSATASLRTSSPNRRSRRSTGSKSADAIPPASTSTCGITTSTPNRSVH